MNLTLRCLAILVLASSTFGQLVLPDRPRSTGRSGSSPRAGNSSPGEGGGSSVLETARAQAAAVFRSIGRRTKATDESMLRGLSTLTALGEGGLLEAAENLDSEYSARLLLAARLLIHSGDEAQRAAVAARLERPLPNRGETAGLLLDLLIAEDPDSLGPDFLVRLLDHSDASMRSAARDRLQGKVDAATVELLRVPFASTRSSTRSTVVDLVSEADTPESTDLLMRALGDSAARVAGAALEHLANSPDPTLNDRLRALALPSAAYDRPAAYALLALHEREIVKREFVLGEADVPRLLAGLQDTRPLVVGACAIGLAGIGYRSTSPEKLTWLDSSVPHALVAEMASELFHKDSAALKKPVLQRLRLLTGLDLGSDPRAWPSWWGERAHGFHAQRAVLPRGPDDANQLVIQLEHGIPPQRFLLLGPEAELPSQVSESSHRIVCLDAGASVSLLERMQSEGWLGAERTPGARGSGPWPRSLSIQLPTGVKRFLWSSENGPPELDRFIASLEPLQTASIWQRWYDRSRFSSLREAWRAESEDWDRIESTPQKERFLLERILARLACTPLEEGELAQGLQALQRALAQPDVRRNTDFEALFELRTSFLPAKSSSRALLREWLELLLPAHDATGFVPVASRLSEDRSARLIAFLADGIGSAALPEVERTLWCSSSSARLAAARDERALVRRASAAPLAFDSTLDLGDSAAVDALRGLLLDPDDAVAIRAVEEVAARRLVDLGAELISLAESARGPIRAAALLAAGDLGGDGVFVACRRAMAEGEPEVKLAAVEAVARLGDASTADWLASHFASGPEGPYFAAARRGLERIGEPAHGELMHLVSSPQRATRREAVLMLSRAGVRRVVTDLLTLLTESPGDAGVAEELAILTCFDARNGNDPVGDWWGWWDRARKTEPADWLRLELDRLGWGGPTPGSLAGVGSAEGAQFLLELSLAPAAHLRERARRDLSAMLRREVSAAPAGEQARRSWYAELGAAIDGLFPG